MKITIQCHACGDPFTAKCPDCGETEELECNLPGEGGLLGVTPEEFEAQLCNALREATPPDPFAALEK